jgi:mRNA interferase RelE/StbE
MKLELSRKAVKAFLELDFAIAGRIMQAIFKIPQGDIKPLTGMQGSFRLRVGDWRILFSKQKDDTLFIEKIAPRGSVYKEG